MNSNKAENWKAWNILRIEVKKKKKSKKDRRRTRNDTSVSNTI